MEWIFNNVDRLKERVYLANYLTKIEIPPEEQSAEITKIAAIIEQKMEEFKVNTSRCILTCCLVNPLENRRNTQRLRESRRRPDR
jgi:hypothetical protein